MVILDTPCQCTEDRCTRPRTCPPRPVICSATSTSWSRRDGSPRPGQRPSTSSTPRPGRRSDGARLEHRRRDAARSPRARSAFDSGAWSSLSSAERSRHLHRLTDVLTSHASELAEIGTLEVGSPITLSRGLHAGAPDLVLPLVGRRGAPRTDGRVRGGSRPQRGAGDGDEHPVPRADRRRRRHRGVQLPAAHHLLQGRRRARGRMHDRADALAAHAAVGRSPFCPASGRPSCRPARSRWCSARQRSGPR